jgi:molybdopterin converting factor small subunit
MTRSANITIRIPLTLRAESGATAELTSDAANLRALLVELERDHAQLYRCVCDETGKVRRHMNLFVNSAHVRDRNGLDTPLEPGDVVSILPAVSGG